MHRGGGNRLTSYISSFGTIHHSLQQPAFTLAEVLITLGIIGVVAAMTMPSLIQNHKKTVVISKLKKISSTISQAYASATDEAGGISPSEDCGTCLLPNNADNALEVVNKYYVPYFNNVEVEKGSNGVFVYFNDDSAFYFRRTQYDPQTENWAWTYIVACISHKACKNLQETSSTGLTVGKNGAVNGKDRFLLYSTGNAPAYSWTVLDRNELIELCKNYTGIEACTALIIGDGWTIAKDYPIRL